MKKNSFWVFLITVLLMGCAGLKTGQDFVNINPGMSRDQVVSVMGQPDSFGIVNGMEVLQWVQRPTRDLSYSYYLVDAKDDRSRADYYVIMRGGVVAEKGTGNVKDKPITNININNY